MWVFLAFLSAVFAGITAILAKIGIKNTDSTVATAIRTVIILAFSWIMVAVTDAGSSIKSIGTESMIFLILSGAATGASWLCYFKALQLGDVCKVTPIDKSSTVLAMLLALIFLSEPLTVFKVIGMIGMLCGTYLMICTPRCDRTQSGNKRWLIYAVLSAVFASLTSILGKVGVENINSTVGTAIRTVVVLIMAWLMVFVTGKKKQVFKTDKRNLVFICLSGITTCLSWLCYYKALKYGQASIVVPIDKLSILITTAFAYFVLHERLSKKAVIGLIILTASTLILLF